jgi:hypothetical protein
MVDVFIFPLNSIYRYNNDYLRPENHMQQFISLYKQFTNNPSETNDLRNIVLEYLKMFSKDSDDFQHVKEYFSQYLDFCPYVRDEFIKVLKAKHIKITFLVNEEESIPLVRFECLLLGIDSLIDNYSVYKDLFLDDELHSTSVEKHHGLVISEELEHLINLPKKFFSVYNILMFNDNKPDYIKLQEKNIHLLKEHFKTFYPDLIIESLRQAIYFIQFIHENLGKSLQQISTLFRADSINVVYILDRSEKAKNYRKREQIISTEKVNYIPYLSLNFEVYQVFSLIPSFQVFLQRCPYLYIRNQKICKDIQSYLDQKLNHVLVLHNMDVIEKCFFRQNVNSMLSDFVNKMKEEIFNKYKIKLAFPLSLNINFDGITLKEVKDEFMKILELNKMEFPFIIKPNPCTLHEMELILNKEGLDNFLNENNLSTILKTREYVIQKYISHGGIMFKTYYIDDKSYTIQRPSLPDLEGENLKIKEFEKGSYNFNNEMIYAKEDKEFWEQLKDNKEQEEELNKQLNKDALHEISQLFYKVENISLFGLDYLLNRGDDFTTYYLLEVNYFPSYRELKDKIFQAFADHITGIYKNKKI